jgi:hypothetical protein
MPGQAAPELLLLLSRQPWLQKVFDHSKTGSEMKLPCAQLTSGVFAMMLA